MENYINISLNNPGKGKLSQNDQHSCTDKESVKFLIEICSLHGPIFIKSKGCTPTDRQGVSKESMEHNTGPKDSLRSRSCSSHINKYKELKTNPEEKININSKINLKSFPYSYHAILSQVIPYLSSTSTVSHEQFKGAHYNTSLTMLYAMLRHDVQFPVRATTIFTNNLTNDNILVRKTSLHVIDCVLKQTKGPHPKIKIPEYRGGNIEVAAQW